METNNLEQFNAAADTADLQNATRGVSFFYGENWERTKKVRVFLNNAWNEVTKDEFCCNKMWEKAAGIKLFDGDMWSVVKGENVNVFFEED